MKTVLVVLAVLAGALAPAAVQAQVPASEVVLENASIRVTVSTFVPGGATGRHQGIEAEIGLVIEGELTVESPMGQQSLRPGVGLLDARSHPSRRSQREQPLGKDVEHLPQALRLRSARPNASNPSECRSRCPRATVVNLPVSTRAQIGYFVSS